MAEKGGEVDDLLLDVMRATRAWLYGLIRVVNVCPPTRMTG